MEVLDDLGTVRLDVGEKRVNAVGKRTRIRPAAGRNVRPPKGELVVAAYMSKRKGGGSTQIGKISRERLYGES